MKLTRLAADPITSVFNRQAWMRLPHGRDAMAVHIPSYPEPTHAANSRAKTFHVQWY